jgi:hypothetical protein
MSVYVDSMRARLGRMVMCHMVADTPEELRAMADRIGVARRWIQDAGTYREHFDVCMAKRALALAHGAKDVSLKDVGLIIRAKREQFLKGELAARERRPRKRAGALP